MGRRIINKSTQTSVDETKKHNKKTSKNTTYTVPNIVNEEIDKELENQDLKSYTYKCCVCGISTNNFEDKIFPETFSNLYVGWDYHLPICKTCIDRLYETYTNKLGMTPQEACRRICMLYDVYYADEIVDIMLKNSKPKKRMSYYISRTALTGYSNKTYGNTIFEEKKKEEEETITAKETTLERYVKEQDIKFWGFGFTPEEIDFLNNKYNEWTSSHECNSYSQKTIFKQISMIELLILKGMKNGESVTALQKQLNEFMNSGKLQPKQNNDSALVETNTFGTLIQKWEKEKPISKPDPEWEDVDKIKHYLTVWFLGHLCKMIGIDNKYSRQWKQIYEDEVEKFTVSPPTYFDTDGEAPSFDEVFNK